MVALFIPDRFIAILLAVIGVAIIVPARGTVLDVAGIVSNAAIFMLFFFHGLRLARRAVIDGLKQWRLQLAILSFSFAVMPLAGYVLWAGAAPLLSPGLWVGVLFLCALPSTVQSAIAYSSIGGGNVAASLIASALSNLAGVILTPLVVALMLRVSGGTVGVSVIVKLASLLVLPFILGQLMQPRLSRWAERHKVWIGRMDKITIILAVLTAFSAATVEGVWTRLSPHQLIGLAVLISGLLGFAMMASWAVGGALGFARADRITLLFSGSQKTLATGAPMARLLFPGPEAGLIIIPLMLYHQFQLIVSAWLAARLDRAT